MPEIRLEGCRPELLGSYLKALGVLRLVAEQKDLDAVGRWEDEIFILDSVLDEEGLVRFFIKEYHPTAIVAPWNKDSGFYRQGTALEAIERSDDPRFADFRSTIVVCRELLKEFRWQSEPGSGDEKTEFLAALRGRLPDSCLRWLDAVAALVNGGPIWAPTFGGAGGVDGRLEFTRVFAEALVSVVGVTRYPRGGAQAAAGGVRASLFGIPERGGAVALTGGLLIPASVDAPNAAQGFLGRKRANPWDYILAVEGALLLAGAVARRFGSPRGAAVFPFTVAAASAGHPSAGGEPSRGEVWLPVWTRATTVQELAQLFREGRAEWQGRPAMTATDMARAIVSLGVDRGLLEFRRFGIQGRSGQSHLAVPLGRWPVVLRPEADLLAELDGLLSSLRAVADRRETPQVLVRALRTLEAAIMSFAAYGGRERLAEVLLAAAAAELAVGRRPSVRQSLIRRPLAGLSGRWVRACDDGSPEFELAAALASLRPAERGPGVFRRHLQPLVRRGESWSWADSMPHEVVWTGRDTLRDLAAVLERRLLDAQREGVDPPLDGRLRAHPASVQRLVEGELDLERLARLVEGLALVDWEHVDWQAEPIRLAAREHPPEAALSATYAVLKLALLGRAIRLGTLEVVVRPDPTVLGLLRAGDVWGAVVRAARRLRAAGLAVRVVSETGQAPVGLDYDLGRRLLAALLVPVHEGPLAQAVLEMEAEEGGQEGLP